MEDTSILVSVIIPFYNRSERINETIASVLNQSFQSWEIIIVDDGSFYDPTPLLRSLAPVDRLKIIRQANQGPSAARNAGVRAAKGEFVAFLDSDDVWMQDKLKLQLELVQKNGLQKFLCFTRTVVERGNGSSAVRPRRAPAAQESGADFLYRAMEFAQVSSFLVPRSVALEVPFDERLRMFEDHLFFIQVGNTGAQYLLVEEPMVAWRDDDRADRASHINYSERAIEFAETNSYDMGAQASHAFRARFVAPLLLQRAPIQAAQLIWTAWREGAITTSDIAKVLARGWIPSALHTRLKDFRLRVRRT